MQTPAALRPSAKAPSAADIQELELVRLVRRVKDAEGAYEPGSTGTVVYVYGDGEALEVELFHPTHAVVTVESADVERLSD